MSKPELRRIDSRPTARTKSELGATLIVRNESLRLPAVLDHHRRIGVDRFFVVDNGSSDGTLELLLAEPDVHVFWTDAPFRTRKGHWRGALVEEFFQDCWSLHIDADELFLHPGMEQIDLHRFCRFLDEEGVAGIVAVMVDMYAKEPPEQVAYQPGESLVERYPFFDRSGYHLRLRGKRKRNRLAPAFQISGGPRERLFFAHDVRAGRWRHALAARLYDIRRTAPHRATRIPCINSVARRALPPYAPICVKVPLLRQEPGRAIQIASLADLHYVEPPIPLSNCWAGLLHFKYMPDLREHVREADEKKLYGGADAEYERYNAVLQQTDELVLYGPQSARFESTADLVEAGLMRLSPEFEAFLSACV